MIKYRLGCKAGHEFESWFPSIQAYDEQLGRGLLACPACGSSDVAKQPMAPAVVSARESAAPAVQAKTPVAAASLAEKLKALRRAVLENSDDVGPRFADEARKIHFGEADERHIHGTSTAEEARDLIDSGVPFGVLPPSPEDLN